MTAAVYCNTPMSVPPTQNTAPVLEFNCLYTRDVRKKSKKWQDGFMRYHTFNKRIMVYDVPRNHVGDTHWTGDAAVREGDELALERDGIMVEVGESLGETETNLSELRQSRKKDTSKENAHFARATPAVTARTQPRTSTQTKHRSLNALLGKANGPGNKAQMSLLDRTQVHAESIVEEWSDGRPSKRPCTESAPVRKVTRTSKTPKAIGRSIAPLRQIMSNGVKRKDGQHELASREVIELSDSDEPQSAGKSIPDFSGDNLAVSSSPTKRMSYNKHILSSTEIQTGRAPPRRDQQALAPQKRDPNTAKLQAARVQARTPLNTLPPHLNSQLSSDMLRISGVPECVPSETSKVLRSPNSPPKQTFRLAETAPKRKTLLCQNGVAVKPKIRHSGVSVNDRRKLTDAPTVDTTSDNAQREILTDTPGITNATGPATVCAGFGGGDILSDGALETHEDGLETKDKSDRSRPAVSSQSAKVDRIGVSHPIASDQCRLRQAPGSTLEPEAPETASTSLSPARHTRQARSRPVIEQQPFKPVLALSSMSKRVAGAPVRYTPLPSPKKGNFDRNSAKAHPEAAASLDREPVPLVENNRQHQHSQEPLIDSKGVAASKATANRTRALGKLSRKRKVPTMSPKDLGPWSREAFDLFTWRPPDWDEEKWCARESTST